MTRPADQIIRSLREEPEKWSNNISNCLSFGEDDIRILVHLKFDERMKRAWITIPSRWTTDDEQRWLFEAVQKWRLWESSPPLPGFPTEDADDA